MDEIKKREEEKRNRAWNPVERWKVLQRTISWAEANLPPEKRRNRPRTHPANAVGQSPSKTTT